MTEPLIRKVESVLFGAGRRLTLEQISVLCKEDPKEVQSALEALKQEYDTKDTSLRVITDGTFWKLTVRENYAETVQKLVTQTELSKTVMETLSVIAYKSPVLQSDVIRIRTNKAYDHLMELEQMGFVTRQKQGRTKIIRLTQKFFDYFDLPEDALKARFATVREKEREVSEHEEQRKQLIEQINKHKEKTTEHDEQQRRQDEEKLKKLDEEITKIEKLETYGAKETFSDEPPSPLEKVEDKVGELDVYETESKEGAHWGDFEVYSPEESRKRREEGQEGEEETELGEEERGEEGGISEGGQESESAESDLDSERKTEDLEQGLEVSDEEKKTTKGQQNVEVIQERPRIGESVEVTIERREGKGMFTEGMTEEVKQKIEQKIEQLLTPPKEEQGETGDDQRPSLDEESPEQEERQEQPKKKAKPK